MLALAALAAGCDGPAQVRRIGTIDPSELRTPARIPGNGFTVEGCCSFDLGAATAEPQLSDSAVYLVRSGERQLTIAFGAHDSAEAGPGYRRVSSRRVDGVELQRWRSAEGLRWTAEVPPSARGKAANLRPYVLRIEVECAGSACDWGSRIAESVRF